MRVLIIGAGAVGSYLMEMLAKMGVSPDTVDPDELTLENAAKNSCLIRTPEDAGRNKAQCASERVMEFLDEGCTSNGIDANACDLGPEAYSDYDVVFVAVDNYDAKVLINEQIRQLPKDRRPKIIVSGTYDETAQSVMLDNTEFCMRCLIDEGWMKDSSVRTSCAGPQIREIAGIPEIIRTSNLASSMAAHLAAEQFRADVIGHKEVVNRRMTYTAYPNPELSVGRPMKKRSCPGCAVRPPEKIEWLPGTVLTKTLGRLLSEVEEMLGTDDFEVSVHRLNFKKTVYAGFIEKDVCRCCGKPMKIVKHEGRTYPQDLICGQCRSDHRSIDFEIVPEQGGVLHAFTRNCSEEVKGMNLFDLGFPLGAHIEVVQRNNALDFLDEGKIISTIFSCSDDHSQMHTVHKL
ncbi:MAG: ThiF family adenylyltransferase [Clostridiales bacterium]|nr:ThiF family adenylyltransferase [Clostridiales bacterium]